MSSLLLSQTNVNQTTIARPPPDLESSLVFRTHAEVTQKRSAHSMNNSASVDQQSQANFAPEVFMEVDGGPEDIQPSESVEVSEPEEQDASSTFMFTKLVAALGEAATYQQILAVKSINSSIDFVYASYRDGMINGGILHLFRIVATLSQHTQTADERMHNSRVLKQNRADPEAVCDVLITLCSLAEVARSSRGRILLEDGLHVALTLARMSYQNYPQQWLMRGRALRLVGALALDGKARNFLRRIQGAPMILKILKETLKSEQNPQNNSVVCGCCFAIQSLLISKRARQQFIQIGGVQSLILVLKFEQSLVSEDLLRLSGRQPRLNPETALFDSAARCLELISELESGRKEILQFQGIERACELLSGSSSAVSKQRAVSILANCAQDPGVDAAVRKAQGLASLCQLLNSNDSRTIAAICRTMVNVSMAGQSVSEPSEMQQQNQSGTKSILKTTQLKKTQQAAKPQLSIQQQLKTKDQVDPDLLTFNKRNPQNIAELCRCKAVQQIAPHLVVPQDALCCQTASDINQVVVTNDRTEKKIKLMRQQRDLLLLAQEALTPLLTHKEGRKTLKSNPECCKELASHLQITDIQVLLSTLRVFCSFGHDAELIKVFVDLGTLRDLFSLLRHSDILVLTGAAAALNSFLNNNPKLSHWTGRNLNAGLESLAKILKTEYQVSNLQNMELKSQVAGALGELARDPENAAVIGQFRIINVIIGLLKQSNLLEPTNATEFQIRQLGCERCCIALATLGLVAESAAQIADSDAPIEICKVFRTANGKRILSRMAGKQLAGQLKTDPGQFGYSYCIKQQNVVQQLQDSEIDLDPQQTCDPFLLTNRAAAFAISGLAREKRCAMVFRLTGVTYVLMTMIGHRDERTAQAASAGLALIRKYHIEVVEGFQRRVVEERPQERNLIVQAVETVYERANLNLKTQVLEDEPAVKNASFGQLKRNLSRFKGSFVYQSPKGPEEFYVDDMNMFVGSNGKLLASMTHTSVLQDATQLSHDHSKLYQRKGVKAGEEPRPSENATPSQPSLSAQSTEQVVNPDRKQVIPE